MHWIFEDKKDLHRLRTEGFTGPEIARLSRLRRTWKQGEMDLPFLDPHRLAFIRWLVVTGRLTDHRV